MKAVILVALLSLIAAGVVEHCITVRADCRTIYTMSEMIERRNTLMGIHEPSPPLSAALTDRCGRYGIDIPAGNR